jgi:hypothetical protein
MVATKYVEDIQAFTSQADPPLAVTKMVQYHAYDANATTSIASSEAAIEGADVYGRSLVSTTLPPSMRQRCLS